MVQLIRDTWVWDAGSAGAGGVDLVGRVPRAGLKVGGARDSIEADCREEGMGSSYMYMYKYAIWSTTHHRVAVSHVRRAAQPPELYYHASPPNPQAAYTPAALHTVPDRNLHRSLSRCIARKADNSILPRSGKPCD